MQQVLLLDEDDVNIALPHPICKSPLLLYFPSPVSVTFQTSFKLQMIRNGMFIHFRSSILSLYIVHSALLFVELFRAHSQSQFAGSLNMF